MITRTETTDWLGTLDWGAADDDYGYMLPGYSATGTLTGTDDVDLIKVPLAALATYSFSVTGDGVTATIIDDMEVVAEGDDLTFTTEHPSEHYYVKLTGTGDYTVHFEGVPADQMPDEDSNTDAVDTTPDWANLNLGQIRTGVINGNDITQDTDYYRTYLVGGVSYDWSMTQTASVYGPTAGGEMKLFDAEGHEMGVSSSSTAWVDGASMTFTPTTTGWYYAAANTYYHFNEAGSYQIAVTESAAPDTTAEVAINGSQLKVGADGEWDLVVNLDLIRELGDTSDVSGTLQLSIVDADHSEAVQVITQSFDFSDTATKVKSTIDLGPFADFKDKSDLIVQISHVDNASLDGDKAFDHVSLDKIDLVGGAGNDTLTGTRGDDVLAGQGGADILKGLKGNDLLNGGNQNDKLLGGKHNDGLFGGKGDDKLMGNSGKDALIGQAGSDTLIGGAGRDVMRGGGGSDTFVFATGSGRDKIKDMEIGIDLIKIGAGASSMSDLTFTTKGSDVEVAFGMETILVKNVTLLEIEDTGNFLF